MADSEVKTYLCKYIVSSLVFMLGDIKLQMDPTNILSIEYLNDYEFNLRAILKLSLRIDVRRKLWLMRNKRDIIVKFELSQVGMDHELETRVTGQQTIFNNTFSMYFNDDDEASDIGVLEARLKKNDNDALRYSLNELDTESYFESQNFVDIYLFDRSLLNASNKTVNTVFTSNTLQQFVGRILTETKHRNVLMSRFSNTEIYNEMLVPALPAYKSLIYLDQYYGFYDRGALIYYDVDTLYILNTNGKVTAKRENEWAETTFLVSRIDNATPGNGMARKPNEKINYVSVNDMNVNPQKFTIVDNAVVGSETKLIIRDDGAIITEDADQSYIDQRKQIFAYIGKDDNKYTANIIKRRLEENECVIYIDAQNVDIGAFKPNKTYHIIFDEQLRQNKYGNYRYRLAYAYHLIRAESDVFMTSSHRFILKRCID